jgi:hypothetical protein
MNRLAHLFRTVRSSRTAVVAAAAAVTAAIAIGIGWGIANAGDGRSETTAASEVAGTPTATRPATSDAGTGDQAAAPPAPAVPAPAAPAPAADPDPDPGPAPAGPRIEYLRVQQQPLCPRGTTQFPIDGRPVALEWRVTGAEDVTLSVDGPGVYATYPAEGSDSFSFGCGGREGDLEEHTYLLTAVADGVTVTETLVVTAEVHDVTDVPYPPPSPGA